MAALGPELAIQLQVDNIAEVKAAFVAAIAGRNSNSLWYLTDAANDLTYENRVKGSIITAIDRAVTNFTISSTLFSDWFRLNNDYFAADLPLLGVISLKQAIELIYRWRVPAYFNDIILSTNLGGALAPGYVWPTLGTLLGTYTLSGGSTGANAKGVGPVNVLTTGPGILAAVAATVIGGADVTLHLTGLRNDLSTVSIPVVVPTTSAIGTTVLAGEAAVTSAHTAVSDAGVLHVSDTSLLTLNQWVLVRETTTTLVTSPLYRRTVSEIAEVVSVGSGQVTLRQITPVGATAPYAAGLRNNYTTSAKMYPLFIDITGVTNSTGTSGDVVSLQFSGDRPVQFITFPLN